MAANQKWKPNVDIYKNTKDRDIINSYIFLDT